MFENSEPTKPPSQLKGFGAGLFSALVLFSVGFILIDKYYLYPLQIAESQRLENLIKAESKKQNANAKNRNVNWKNSNRK